MQFLMSSVLRCAKLFERDRLTWLQSSLCAAELRSEPARRPVLLGQQTLGRITEISRRT